MGIFRGNLFPPWWVSSHGQSPLRAPGWNSQNLGRHGSRSCVAGRLRGPVLALGQQPSKDFAAQRRESRPRPHRPSLPGSQADAQSLQQVMSELQQVGAIDPAAQDKLMADLKQVDPSLWPMVLQTFRAEAAYQASRRTARGREDQERQAGSHGPRYLARKSDCKDDACGRARDPLRAEFALNPTDILPAAILPHAAGG